MMSQWGERDRLVAAAAAAVEREGLRMTATLRSWHAQIVEASLEDPPFYDRLADSRESRRQVGPARDRSGECRPARDRDPGRHQPRHVPHRLARSRASAHTVRKPNHIGARDGRLAVRARARASLESGSAASHGVQPAQLPADRDGQQGLRCARRREVLQRHGVLHRAAAPARRGPEGGACRLASGRPPHPHQRRLGTRASLTSILV